MESLQVKYLAIDWQDENTVLKIEESIHSVDFEGYDGDIPVLQTTTFKKIHSYIGFCIEEELLHTPYFELANGNKDFLISFQSPSNGKVWWIQNSGWKKDRYLSELYRTVGNVYVVIQNKRIKLENNYIEFSAKELEYYLSDFKNDLWLLILDNENSAKAKVNKEVPNLFQDEILNFFKDFTEVIEKLVVNPNMFLSERQSTLPIKKVKPLPKTFRELIENPNRKHATSRDFYESFDTPENRYVHYCVDRVLYLLKSFDKLAHSQIASYDNKIKQENEWKKELTNQTSKKVDKYVFEEEINTLEQQLNKIIQDFTKLKININPGNCHEYDQLQYINYNIRIGKKLENESAFFVQELNGVKYSEFSKEYGASSIIFRIKDKNFTDFDFSKLKININFAGFANFRRITSKDKNKIYDNFDCEKITWIDFDETQSDKYTKLFDKLNELKTRKSQLEKSNWTIPLSNIDKQEQTKEIAVINHKINLFEKVGGQIKSISPSIRQYIARIKATLSFFKANKIKKTSSCPNSMVFIQNPVYASCKSLFKQIMNINGLDIHLFEMMMQIDEIGLVNTSNLYEKWCLLQCIKVLKNHYGFQLEDDWQQSLIKSVLQKEYNILIKLENKFNFQRIDLTYEKILDSGKRPDIVLDLFYEKFKVNHQRSVLEKQRDAHKRLVLDAKFKNYEDEDALHAEIDLLYKIKDYAENETTPSKNNQVFIIHPKAKAIDKPTSPLDWGRYNDYGQSHDVNHQYGAIFLSPSLNYPTTLDNLQRLLGMFLQDNSERHEHNGNRWHNMCCISCGNTDRTSLKLQYSKTKGDADRWTLSCSKCKLITVQTVCFNCKNTIFKNGLKWTYHRSRAEQTSNIVCPRCQSFL